MALLAVPFFALCFTMFNPRDLTSLAQFEFNDSTVHGNKVSPKRQMVKLGDIRDSSFFPENLDQRQRGRPMVIPYDSRPNQRRSKSVRLLLIAGGNWQTAIER
jgi:hypothetical protein